MSSVVVLGGGISGLSCAYYLCTLGKHLIKRVTLIERESFLGGWIQSERYPDGTVHELGPRSVRPVGKSGYNALTLVEELGLSNEVIPVLRSHAASQKRFIMVENKLLPLPSSLGHVFKPIPPFKRPLGLAILKDLFTPGKCVEDDSIDNFATRRFGVEVAKYLVDPLCRGIFAGSSRKLGVRSAFNTFYKAEHDHGSVIKGLLKSAKESTLKDFLHSNLAVKSKAEKWAMWSLQGGLQTLPDTLEKFLNKHAEIHINTYCSKINFEENRAKLHMIDFDIEADHLFACLPARALSKLVSQQFPILAKQLSLIPSVHVAVVNLEYHGKVLPEAGFGFLVPSSEESKVLGITFDSCCFPIHDGKYEEKTRITCMMGGYWFSDLFGSPDTVNKETILSAAIEAAGKHLRITQKPSRYIVNVLKNCIPQYVVGHHNKVSAVKDEIIKEKVPLSLLGSSYDGVSVSDCIYNSRKGVEQYLETLT